MTKIIKTAAVCAVVAFALSVTGCSRITVLRTKEMHAARDTLYIKMQAELAALRTQIAEEQNKLLAEQAKMFEEQKTAAEMLRLLRADQVVRFNDIDRKISAVERNLYESQTRLSRLDQRTSEVNRRLEQKLASDDDAANQRQLQLEKLFEIAMSDFNAGRYDLAVSGFVDFSKQYPDAPQSADAKYWVAECHYARKEYEAAERAYLEFIKKYPDGARSCASFYKLGLAYDKQEKVKSRDMVWKNLLDRCPDSQEAQAVKAQTGGR